MDNQTKYSRRVGLSVSAPCPCSCPPEPLYRPPSLTQEGSVAQGHRAVHRDQLWLLWPKIYPSRLRIYIRQGGDFCPPGGPY